MDECVVTYSSELARQAGHFSLRRRYLTKLGHATPGALLIPLLDDDQRVISGRLWARCCLSADWRSLIRCAAKIETCSLAPLLLAFSTA
jgi:hypothetical protein